MPRKQDKTIERERAYYQGELVTVLHRGKVKSTIRTSHGFEVEGIKTRDLDFKSVPEELKVLRFEAPSG
jgi:hypothetical protein